jgi:large subunit ribosomal protein L20
MRGTNYSRFMGGLKKANVELDRKILANLALTDEQTFDRLVNMAQEAF